MLTRRHGKTDGSAERRQCALAGDSPTLPPDGPRTEAQEPGISGTAMASNLVSSEPEGSRAQETRARLCQLRQLRRDGKTTSHSAARAHPLSAARLLRGNRGQRLVCPLGGSSSRSLWPKASVCAAPPLAKSGTARAAGATARGAAQSAPQSAPGSRNQHPSCSPRRCSCSLPSDSAAQKANGKGASFKVHINLVLVGYSLAATTAVLRRMVLTTQLNFLLAKRSAFPSPG